MSILWVSSFKEDMYEISGKRLLDSYLKFQSEFSDQQLLLCVEGFNFEHDKFLVYQLDQSEYLNNWLKNNSDVIPDYMGGNATKESHPEIFENFWNRKASRWFRKVASLEYAMNHYGDDYQYIIWIDSDCYFKEKLRSDFIRSLFGNYNAIYHLGSKRLEVNKGIESGVIGFQKKYELLRKVIKSYETRDYLNYDQWDDGYIFMVFLKDDSNAYDLVSKHKKQLMKVLKISPFTPYIEHDKGLHFKSNISYLI